MSQPNISSDLVHSLTTATAALALALTVAPPAELTALPQWVAYRLEARSDKPKPAKMPYRTVHQRADATAPATWLSYAAAASLAAADGFHGVGFVFSPTDPYCGVDLDACRDRATGAVQPWAVTLLKRLNSYAEVSPSGTGLHVLMRGALPGHAGRRGVLANAPASNVEVYDAGRYFTVTGQALAGYDKIHDAQPALDWLVAQLPRPATPEAGALPPARATDLTDDALLARLATSKDAQAFHRLYVAGETRPNHSQSEDDFELACIFARHVGGDVDRIERLLRESALADRAKWDRADYLPRTIRAAVLRAGGNAGAVAVERERGALLTFADLLTLPTLPWLIEGLLPAEGVTVVYGSYAAYKSFVVLDWLAAVAGGAADWFGLPITKHGPAAYVYAEGRSGLGQRAQAVKLARHLPDDLPLVVRPTALDVADPAAVDQLIADIGTVLTGAAPAVVAIDTLARNMPGGDENKQQDMNAFVGGCDRLRTAFGCQVVVVHHENKDGAMRGSTVVPGAADTLIEIKRQADCETRLKVTKQKDGEEPAWTVRLRREADSLTLASVEQVGAGAEAAAGKDPFTPGEREVLQAFFEAAGPLTVKDWAATVRERVNLGGEVVKKARQKAIKLGLIVSTVDKKRWQAAPRGWAYAEAQKGWEVIRYPDEPATAVDAIV